MVLLNPTGCRRILLSLAVLLASSSLFCTQANAQVSGGTISGTVTNTSQLAMPNVHVTVKNVATGAARAVATDPAGSYAASNLAPGTYEMTVEASGFSTQLRTNIPIAPGVNLTVNVVMHSGTRLKRCVRTGRFPTTSLT